MWKSYVVIALSALLMVVGLLFVVAYQCDTDPSYFTTTGGPPVPTGCAGCVSSANISCPTDVTLTSLRSHTTIIDVLKSASLSSKQNTGFAFVYIILVGVLWIFITLHDIYSVRGGRSELFTIHHFVAGCGSLANCLKYPGLLFLSAFACYSERWAAKAFCICVATGREEMAKFPCCPCLGFFYQGGLALATKTNECIKALSKGEADNLCVTLLRTLAVLIVLPFMLVLNIIYWVAVVFPVFILVGGLAGLIVYVLAPLWLIVVGAIVFAVYGAILGVLLPFLMLFLFILTVRYPLKTSLFNSLWPALILIGANAYVFFDTIVALSGSGGGQLQFGTARVTMSPGCDCNCTYNVNSPKLVVLLIIAGFAILWLMAILWNATKNFAKRGEAYHKLLTVTYALPVAAVIKLQPEEPALGISSALLTHVGISIEKPAKSRQNTIQPRTGSQSNTGHTATTEFSQVPSTPGHNTQPSQGGYGHQSQPSQGGGYDSRPSQGGYGGGVPQPPPGPPGFGGGGVPQPPPPFGGGGGFQPPPPAPAFPGYGGREAAGTVGGQSQYGGGASAQGYDDGRGASGSQAQPPEPPADHARSQSTASQAGFGGVVPDAPPM